ncbi:IDEAL domain-containing protein [Alicyclobacillus fastidiosus]|uniref:IDEAL domain-containing protein n=1 Tax=Alicyclobacillus fastidiosus TaxID=392011 RepID=A0ABV5AH66_9BACL|nr:IDEAL domain-containing protein [Alicyclobacillus fastidiosus]WEH08141.1 IDEAL domain-containing protein [Alicyclobacillus fastidiosus]
MMTKDEILTLKTKLLPSGADSVIDYLAARHAQLEATNIVLENVPLLIIGRHGMIARIPINGRIKKVSQADEVLQALQTFFAHQANSSEKLYVFVNLPDLPIPPEVQQVLSEVEERAKFREQIKQRIDQALDQRDKAAFDAAVKELELLQREEERQTWRARRFL